MKIILGSQSPRRRELLRGMDIEHSEVVIDTDESYPSTLRGGDIPIYISRAKARAYLAAHSLSADELLITSDTIVWSDGCVLGKPHTEDEARQMLRSLSDKTHQVFTAVSFVRLKDGLPCLESFADRADVTFLPLSDADIDYYVSHYHPLDKAGAYGIQEWIGYIGVSGIRGSFFTVMGFPTHLVHRYIADLNHAQS